MHNSQKLMQLQGAYQALRRFTNIFATMIFYGDAGQTFDVLRKGTNLVVKSHVKVNCPGHRGGDLTALLHMCVGPCMTHMATVRLQPLSRSGPF